MESQHNEDTMRVACLAAEGKSQKKIAESLAMSQPKVSRHLKLARELGYVVDELRLPPGHTPASLGVSAIKSADLDRLEKYIREASARSRGVTPTELEVLHSGDDEEKRLEKFGNAAARRVIPLLRERDNGKNKVRICAVSGGRTVECLVSAMERCPIKEKANIEFLPVAGERWSRTQHVGISPSDATQRLTDLFVKDKAENSLPALSLKGLPTRIPPDLDKTVIEKFLNSAEAYREIFTGSEGEKAKIELVDAMITSIGGRPEDDPWVQEMLQSEGLTLDELKQHAAGNLAGVLFPKDPTDETETNRINEHWCGMAEKHIRECSVRAHAEKRPGVIVLAMGKEKAKIVPRALGLINHLFIDHILAEEILRDVSE